MSVLNLILNIIWVLTGGLWMAVAWLIAAVIIAITIIGIPWARATFNIANYTLLPFGRVALSREQIQRHGDIGTRPLGANLIWLLLAGWWLAPRTHHHGRRTCNHHHWDPVRMGTP